MSTPIKVSVIGAGSAQFSLGLVKDICLTENLAGSQISFMDIDLDRLEMIEKLAQRYANELGADLRFERTSDGKVSMQEADFVINTENIEASLANNPILVTALNTEIGYSAAAQIAKQAYAQKRPILEVAAEMTDIPMDRLLQLLNPENLV